MAGFFFSGWILLSVIVHRMLLTVGHLVDISSSTSDIQVSDDIPSKPLCLRTDGWLLLATSKSSLFASAKIWLILKVIKMIILKNTIFSQPLALQPLFTTSGFHRNDVWKLHIRLSWILIFKHLIYNAKYSKVDIKIDYVQIVKIGL